MSSGAVTDHICSRDGDRAQALKRHGWLVASMVCAIFSVGYQPIAVCQWLQLPCLLWYLETGPRTWGHWGVAWLMQSLGLWGASAGTFNNPHWIFSQVMTVLVVALVLYLPVLGAIGLYIKFGERYNNWFQLRCLVLPLAYTTWFFLLSLLSPIGAYMAPAYSQYSFPPLVQLVSLLGIDGITFLIAWFASTSTLFLQSLPDPDLEPSERPPPYTARWRPLVAFVSTMLAVLIYGGASITVFNSDLFYQRTTEGTIGAVPTMNLGCIIAQEYKLTDSKMEKLWAMTEEHAAVNNITLWSEEAVSVYSPQEETVLLDRAKEIATTNNAYLGVTYGLFNSQQDLTGYNIFTFIGPDGNIAFKYIKTHPVPGVEVGIIPGKAKRPPVVNTPFGKVGGAICFDMDFPQWVMGSSYEGIDLMLQPSWTWGPIGSLHAVDNAFRAVENGFQLFRCSSGGVSGAFSAVYGFESWKYTGRSHGGIKSISLPMVPKRFTVYPYIGFLFPWACLITTCLALLLVFLPDRYLTHLCRRGTTDRDGRSWPLPTRTDQGPSYSVI